VERAFEDAPGGPAVAGGSVLDKIALERLFQRERFDAVMHFSALALVGESVTAPERYYENNVSGALNLMLAMVRAGVDKFIFSSSCAVYGAVEKMPISDDLPTNPVNPYGRSKRMTEMMMADLASARGLKCAALRYFNAAGADPEGGLGEAHDPESHLIPNVVKNVLERRALKVFGHDYPTPDGTCVRDYIHVLDLAEAHLLALNFLNEQDGGVFEAFNLGTGRGTSNLEIIRSVEKVSGRKVSFEYGPRRPGDPPSLYADATKAVRVLKWRPKFTDIDDIVATAWQWHTSSFFPRHSRESGNPCLFLKRLGA
jgi:UDP-glucose-4-epimerase GalE